MTIRSRLTVSLGLMFALVGFTLTGCESSTEPAAPEQGELQQYLADNPDVLEDEEIEDGDNFDAAADSEQ